MDRVAPWVIVAYKVDQQMITKVKTDAFSAFRRHAPRVPTSRSRLFFEKRYPAVTGPLASVAQQPFTEGLPVTSVHHRK